MEFSQAKEQFVNNIQRCTSCSIQRISEIFDKISEIFSMDPDDFPRGLNDVESQMKYCLGLMKDAAQDKEEMFVFTSALSMIQSTIED